MDVSFWKELLDVVAKASVIVAVASYFLNRRSMALQHERARREKAMTAVHEFSRSLSPRSAAARKLLKHFTDLQIEALDQGREFAVAPEHRDLLNAAIHDLLTEDQMASPGEIRLTRYQSYMLRWEVVSQLNSCEVAAQYWFTNIAYRRTIEDELRFLLDAEPGRNILTTFRSIVSTADFPAISALILKLEQSRGRAAELPDIAETDIDRFFTWFASPFRKTSHH